MKKIARFELSDMQKAYIWLAGMHGGIRQAQGIRGGRLKYGIIGTDVFVFGYASPASFLEKRGFLTGNIDGSYSLTAQGQQAFSIMSKQGYVLPAEKIEIAA